MTNFKTKGYFRSIKPAELLSSFMQIAARYTKLSSATSWLNCWFTMKKTAWETSRTQFKYFSSAKSRNCYVHFNTLWPQTTITHYSDVVLSYSALKSSVTTFFYFGCLKSTKYEVYFNVCGYFLELQPVSYHNCNFFIKSTLISFASRFIEK